MIYFLLLVGVIFLDQITKIAVQGKALASGGEWKVTLIDGVLNLRLQRNSGAAFSFIAGEEWARVFFIVITCIALPLLYIVFLRLGKNRKWLKTAIILIIGGTIGNFIERVVFGSVTDFIDVVFFANFNVADSALCIGAAMLIVWFLFMDEDALLRFHRKKADNG